MNEKTSVRDLIFLQKMLSPARVDVLLQQLQLPAKLPIIETRKRKLHVTCLPSILLHRFVIR